MLQLEVGIRKDLKDHGWGLFEVPFGLSWQGQISALMFLMLGPRVKVIPKMAMERQRSFSQRIWARCSPSPVVLHDDL